MKDLPKQMTSVFTVKDIYPGLGYFFVLLYHWFFSNRSEAKLQAMLTAFEMEKEETSTARMNMFFLYDALSSHTNSRNLPNLKLWLLLFSFSYEILRLG